MTAIAIDDRLIAELERTYELLTELLALEAALANAEALLDRKGRELTQ